LDEIKIMEVVLIKPPYMQLSKPDYRIPDSLLHGIDYLSPSILIQANAFYLHGIPVKICIVEDIKNLTEVMGCLSGAILVGISCTCAWEYLETLFIAEIIKKYNNKIKIAVGGWQIKSIGSRVFNDSEFVDFAITDDNDESLYNLFCELKRNKPISLHSIIYEKNQQSYIESLKYNYSLYPNYKNFIPFVEESRGCPNNCSFCLNSSCGTGYYRKKIDDFAIDIKNIESYYGMKCETILLAANFGVVAHDTREKLEVMRQHELLWNLEMHVDNPWESYVSDLYNAGIRKVSIGLESSSPTILQTMKKTNNSYKYLLRAKELLFNLKKHNIRTTVNMLVHYKDTKESLYDTITFLLNNSQYIDRVRFNHMYLFDGIKDLNVERKYMVKSKYNELLHVIPLCPEWINIDELLSLFENIERLYNKKKI